MALGKGFFLLLFFSFLQCRTSYTIIYSTIIHSQKIPSRSWDPLSELFLKPFGQNIHTYTLYGVKLKWCWRFCWTHGSGMTRSTYPSPPLLFLFLSSRFSPLQLYKVWTASFVDSNAVQNRRHVYARSKLTTRFSAAHKSSNSSCMRWAMNWAKFRTLTVTSQISAAHSVA